jgi:ribosomal protein S18 acetylase RimI-like enzyme
MHPLDNVIWQALITRQAQFAETFHHAKRFFREITALTALEEIGPAGYASLAGLVGDRDTALLSLADPYEPLAGWELVTTFPGLQMVCEDHNANFEKNSIPGFRILKLGQPDAEEMLALATLTKPGPFGMRTYELGTYLGIRWEGKLVAMAGERLKVPGFTEVSAVCTHPEHLGNGYARTLMLEIMRGIHQRGETSFLHVRQNNARAVELYERLGFRTRRVVYFTVLRKSR